MNMDNLFNLVVCFYIPFILAAAFNSVMYPSAFVAQTAFHRFPEINGINELYFPFPFFGFVVPNQPNVSGNARIVKQFGRQGHNGFKQIILHHMFSDFAFTTTCVTTKQRRSVVNNGNGRATLFNGLHLAYHVQSKKQLSIAATGLSNFEPAVAVSHYFLLYFLPTFAIRRI